MKKKLFIGIAIIILIIAIIVGGFLFLNKDDKLTDAEKFSKEYTTITENNVFVYRDIEEIINIMEHGTGIVYLGFPECPWCQTYVKYLNEVAKEVGIEKIYYFNILEDRQNNTDEYKKIIELLTGNLQFDEEGKERIFVPNVSFHINGSVIGNDYETSKDTHDFDNPEDYWNEEEVKDLKTKLKQLMIQIKNANEVCTDCNK